MSYQTKKQMPWYAPARKQQLRKTKRLTPTSPSTVEKDASTDVFQLNVMPKPAHQEHFAKIGGFSSTRMPTCTQLKPTKKDGAWLRASSFLKAASSCNTWEKSFQRNQNWASKECRSTEIQPAPT